MATPPRSCCGSQITALDYIFGTVEVVTAGATLISGCLQSQNSYSWAPYATTFIMTAVAHISVKKYGNITAATNQMRDAAEDLDDDLEKGNKIAEEVKDAAGDLKGTGIEIHAAVREISLVEKGLHETIASLKEELAQKVENLKELQGINEGLSEELWKAQAIEKGLKEDLLVIPKLVIKIDALKQEIESLKKEIQSSEDAIEVDFKNIQKLGNAILDKEAEDEKKEKQMLKTAALAAQAVGKLTNKPIGADNSAIDAIKRQYDYKNPKKK